jgi:hypothetical protein
VKQELRENNYKIVIVIKSLPSTMTNWTFFQKQKNQTKWRVVKVRKLIEEKRLEY